MQNIIKFSIGELDALRSRLLKDTSKEQFALLLCRKNDAGNVSVFCVEDIVYFDENSLIAQERAYLEMSKDKIYDVLSGISGTDINAIIDVHTHPFTENAVGFSYVDDRDEMTFGRYLHDNWNDISYGSLVLSRRSYSARVWCFNEERKTMEDFQASVRSCVRYESFPQEEVFQVDERLDRSVLALGLDVMRRITKKQIISIFGVGGLGSVWAENIVHSGFSEVHIVDKDTVSITNLNRIVGATYDDALAERKKTECLKKHLEDISPSTDIFAHDFDILSTQEEMSELIAKSDWVLFATDDHASRFCLQRECRKFGTPFISAGVNITVNDGIIKDISGEVVTVRPGDELCLSCLGRINPMNVAKDTHFNSDVSDALVNRGYVKGHDVNEPAVKTLNSIMAAIGTDVLINQYTGRQKHEAIWVYEDNDIKCIYPDEDSVRLRLDNCACHRYKFTEIDRD